MNEQADPTITNLCELKDLVSQLIAAECRKADINKEIATLKTLLEKANCAKCTESQPYPPEDFFVRLNGSVYRVKFFDGSFHSLTDLQANFIE